MSFEPKLINYSRRTAILQKWNARQYKYDSTGFKLIEIDDGPWQLLSLNPDTKIQLWSKSASESVALYLASDPKKSAQAESVLIHQLRAVGVLVPCQDIVSFSAKQLDEVIGLVAQIANKISLLDLIKKMKTDNNSAPEHTLPFPVISTIWFLEEYVNIMVKSDSINHWHDSMRGWITHFAIDDSSSDAYLFLQWMASHIDKVIRDVGYDILNTIDHKSAYIRSLILKYRTVITNRINAAKKSESSRFSLLDIPELVIDLDHLISQDLDNIMIEQMVMIEEADRPITWRRQRDLLKKIKARPSIFSRLGKAFSKSSMVETLQSVSAIHHHISQVGIFRKSEFDWTYLDKISREISGLVRDELLMSALTHYNTPNSIFASNVDYRRKEYLAQIGSLFSRPFYKWECNSDGTLHLIPNIANREDTKQALSYLNAKNRHEKQEARVLEKHIEKLRSLPTTRAVDEMVISLAKFHYPTNQKKWSYAVDEAYVNIKRRAHFRTQKMKELGIDFAKDLTDHEKGLYLDEMLAIEKEIRKFVPYVTATFMAALPKAAVVDFDQYRHTTDGIEFDPITIQNPEKWMRGEVMKPLKKSTKTTEVTQVNCFCLDLSASMDHDRMRNLFKTLYLLVTGLQGRKSFDAFHFFSNNFIEGVDFSRNHTSKVLLFNILRFISVSLPSTILYRGIEGTNISAGITGCEKKMIEFVDNLRKEQPDIAITKSIFVITDGEPSLGIRNLHKLSIFVQESRVKLQAEIKGIYIKSKDDEKQFIAQIFGEEHSVETSDFEEGVHKLTSMMRSTYQQQRIDHKWQKRKDRMLTQTRNNHAR